MSLWSLPVFLWCFDFLTFVCILLFLHSNYWLNVLTQAGAFSPCLCVYVTLFFLCLYPSFYFYPCLWACLHTLSPLCPPTPLLAQCSTYLPHSPLYSHASPPPLTHFISCKFLPLTFQLLLTAFINGLTLIDCSIAKSRWTWLDKEFNF